MLKDAYKKIVKLDHHFPNKEILLMQKLHKEDKLSEEDLETISNLLHKYLNLRADVFYDE